MTPAAIQDRGLEYDVSEFPLVDQLFARVLHGTDVADLAAPGTAGAIRQGFGADAAHAGLGSVQSWQVTCADGDDVLDLWLDVPWRFRDPCP